MGQNPVSPLNLRQDSDVRAGLAVVTLAAGWGVASAYVQHVCPGNVIVSVTLPEHGTFETSWCLDCLEDADPLDAVSRLLPASTISVRAAS